MKKILILAAAITAITVITDLTACAVKGPPAALGPNVQLEGRAAFYADQVVKMSDWMLDSVEIITDQRLALQPDPAQDEKIKAEARSMIQVAQVIGKGGSDLAVVLKAVNDAKNEVDRTAALVTARTAMLAFSKTIRSEQLKAVTDGGGLRAIALRYLGQVGDMLLQAALVLPQPERNGR